MADKATAVTDTEGIARATFEIPPDLAEGVHTITARPVGIDDGPLVTFTVNVSRGPVVDLTPLPRLPADQHNAVRTAVRAAIAGQTFTTADVVSALAASYWFHGIGVETNDQPVGSITSWGLAGTATAAGGARPTQQTTGMQFDGTDDFLDLGAPIIPATASWQVHFAAQPEVHTTGQMLLAQFADASEGRFLVAVTDAVDRIDMFAGGLGVNPRLSFATPSSTRIYLARRDGNDFSVGMDGSYSAVASSAGGIQQTNTTIGKRIFAPEEHFKGEMAGFVIHPSDGGDGVELMIRRFMNSFYGIA